MLLKQFVRALRKLSSLTLAESGLTLITGDDILDAAKKIVTAVKAAA